ncbi:hypothetical protein CK507_18710 [Pseudomonas sp. WN033]|nr:hypothetical protein CK507_18710 [Pseudomonas sp. WN033]
MAGKAFHGSSLKYYWLLGLCGPAMAQATEMADALADIEQRMAYWSPQLYQEIKLGNQRNIATLGLMLPLTQNPDHLLFADLRGRADDRSSQEYNLGLGFRWEADDELLFGLYGYYDHLHSREGNRFRQATLGLEVQSALYSARVNRYVPVGRRSASVGGQFTDTEVRDAELQVIDSQLTFVADGVIQNTFQREERSLGGHDLELGFHIPGIAHDVAVYAGYYKFDASGARAVEGPRLRAQWQAPLDGLKAGASLSLGAEWQNDGVRGTNSYVSVGLNIPLGGGSRSAQRSGSDWQRDRMLAQPVRDVDVVAIDSTRKVGSVTLPAVNELAVYEDGQAIGRVVYAQAGASGDGTTANPAGLTQALNNLVEDDGLLVLSAGGGAFAEGGNLSANSLRVLSGGAGITVRGSTTSGLTGVFSAPEGRAQLDAGLTVSGNDARISGVDLNGGLIANGVSDLSLTQGRVGDLQLNAVGGRVQLAQMQVSGLQIDGGDADVHFASGSLERSQAGNLLDVRNMTGGSLQVDAPVRATGASGGVFLDASPNTAVHLAGGVDIAIDAGDAFVARQLGSLSLSGSNSLASDGGSALRLESLSVGSAGLALDSLTSRAAAGYGVQLEDVAGELSFAEVLIEQAGSDGIRISGGNGSLQMGAVQIRDSANVGLNLEDSSTDIVIQRLDIEGGVTAIDLTSATGQIEIVDGGDITGFSSVGVQFSNTDDTARSANAQFRFGGGSIVAGPGGFVLDGIGLDPLSGLYDFTGVDLQGDFRFSPNAGVIGDLYFVAASATGNGSGSDTANLASIADAQTRADSGLATTFVFVNDGSVIDVSGLAGGTFQLSAGQAITGFGNGNSLGLDVPLNIIGNIAGAQLLDPTGNGAAQLTSNSGSVISTAGNSLISHVELVGNGNSAVYADGHSGLSLLGTQISGVYDQALALVGMSGSVNLLNNHIIGTGQLLRIDGGDAEVNISVGSGLLQGQGLSIRDTLGGSISIQGAQLATQGEAAVTLDNNAANISLSQLQINRQAGDTAFLIDTFSGDSTGRISLSGSLDSNSGTAFDIGRGARDILASGIAINATGGTAPLVRIDQQSGGSIALGNLLSSGSSAANVIISTNQSGGSLSFADLQISGYNSPGGQAISLQGSGAGSVSFDSLSLTVSAGNGLRAEGVSLSAGQPVHLDQQQGVALNLQNVSVGGLQIQLEAGNLLGNSVLVNGLQGDLRFAGVTRISGAGGDAIVLDGINGALSFDQLALSGIAGAGLTMGSLAANNGQVTIEDGSIDDAAQAIVAINTEILINALRVGGNDPINNDAIVLINNDAITRRYRLNQLEVDAGGHGLSVDNQGSGDLWLELNDSRIGADGSAVRVDGSAGSGELFVTALQGNQIVRAGSGAMLFESVIFDADPLAAGYQSVPGGDIAIGNPLDLGAIEGDGLWLNNVLGNLALSALDIANSNGTGLYIRDAEGKGGNFAFANSSGSIDTLGGSAIDIDPVTMDSQFASVRSTDAAGSGILIDTISGSIVIGATQVINAGGDGIVVINSDGDFSFGQTLIEQTGQDGIRLDGASGELNFGDISLLDIGATGVNFEGFTGHFNASRLDVDGARTAIDLTRAAGIIQIAQGGVLENFSETGIQFSRSDDLADSADALFIFGGGSITASGAAVVLDGIGLDSTRGTYDLTGVALNGNFRFSPSAGQVGDLYFVAANASGAGDGSSVSNLASVSAAQARADTGLATTFVFVNDGNAVDFSALAGGSFTLADGQVVSSFGNGNSFGLEVPINIIGAPAGLSISDPTGNGAAVLTSSTGHIISVGNGNQIRHVAFSGGSSAIFGDGFSDLSVSNSVFGSSSDFTFDLRNASGTLSFSHNDVNTGSGLLNLDGGNANLLLSAGTGSISAGYLEILNTSAGSVQVTGAALNSSGHSAVVLGGNAASVTLTDLLVSRAAGDIGFDIDRNAASSGAILINGTSSLDSNSGTAFVIGAGARNISALDLAITSLDSVDRLVDITGMSGGTISLGDMTSTDSTGEHVIRVSGSAGTLNLGDVSIAGFNRAGGTAVSLSGIDQFNAELLDIDTTLGAGLVASGLTLGIAGSNQIHTQGGIALHLTNVDIAAAGVILDSVQAVNTGGVNQGIRLTNLSGGELRFDAVELLNVGGRAINVEGHSNDLVFNNLNIQGTQRNLTLGQSAGDVTISNATFGTVTSSSGFGMRVEGQQAGSTLTLNNVNLTSNAADAVSFFNNAGTINATGGTWTHTGTASVVGLTSGAGTYNIGANLVHTADAVTLGAVEINDTSGDILFSGNITNTGGGRLLRIGQLAATTAGNISFTGNLSDTGGRGNVISNLNAGATVTLDGLSVANNSNAALTLTNIAGTLNLSGTTSFTNAGTHGLLGNNIGGTLTIDGLVVNGATNYGVRLGNNAPSNGSININGGSIDGTGSGGILATNSNLTLGSMTLGGSGALAGTGIELINNDATHRHVGISNTSVSALGGGIAVTKSGAGDLRVVLDGNTVNTGSGTGIAVNGVAGAGELFITSFNGNTVNTAGNGGMLINNAIFDADPDTLGYQQVAGGNTRIGNLLDSTEISGHGLWLNDVLGDIAFGTLEISNDGGTGLFIRDADGKAGTFNFGNTGGSIVTTNGAAIDIDPVVMDSTFTSVSSSNASGAGILIDTISGSISIDQTSVINAGTDGIAIIDSDGDFSFGETLIEDAGNDGVRLAGSSGVIVFGAMTLNDITRTGVNFSDFSGDFTAQSLDLDGAVTAIDLTNAGGVIVFTDGGLLQNFSGTGVQFSSTDDTADSADADFTFGGGSINAGAGAFFIDGIGLDETQGSYDFTGVSFSGNARLPPSGSGQIGDLYFVSNTGTGDGSSTGSAAGLAAAQARADSGLLTTFVFINDGSPIDFSSLTDGSFKLSAGQAVSSFGNGNEFGLLIPANLLGDFGDVSISDPTGNGAAVLTSTTGNVLTLSDNNYISNLSLSGGLNSLYGDGFNGLTVENTSFAAAANFLFNLNNAAGTLLIRDNVINNVTGQLLSLNGGNANLTLQAGSGSLSGYGIDLRNTTGGSLAINGASLNANGAAALTLNGNVAPVTLTDVSLAGTTAHYLFDIDRTTASSGAINLGNSTLGSFSGGALYIGAGARNVNASGFNIVAASQSNRLVDITGQSGGAISFGNITSTAQTGAGYNVIRAQNQSAGNLSFGTVNVSGFNANGGFGALLTGSAGNTGAASFAELNINSQLGSALFAENTGLTVLDGNLVVQSGSTGLTLNSVAIGAGGVNLDLVSAVINGSGSVVDITNSTGNVTLGSVIGSSAGTDVVTLFGNTGTYRFDSLSLTSGTGRTFSAVNTGNLIVNNAGTGISSTSGPALRIMGTAVSGSGFSQITRTGTASGTAIELSDNTGTTRLNGVNVNGGGTAFSVSNAGTLEVLGSANTITTNANSTALNVANTTIGAGGLNFRSISSTGGTNGIVLTNTGLLGGINVTGVGTTVGSGGTISGASGAGILLTNSVNARFNGMTITGSGSHGLDGAVLTALTPGGNALTFSNGQILNAAGDGINMTRTSTNIVGAMTLTNVLFDGYARNGLWVSNFSGNTIVNMDGVTFRNANALTNDQAALFVAALNGTAGFDITVRDSTFGSAFGSGIDSICCSGIRLNAEGSGSHRLDVAGSTFQNISRGGSGTGIIATATQTAQMELLIANNQFIDLDSSSLALGAYDNSVVNGSVTNNQFSGPNLAASVAVRLVGDGGGTGNFSGRFVISDNIINGLEQAVVALSRNTSSGRLDVSILNNNITTSFNNEESIMLNGVNAGATLCGNLQGNSINHTTTFFDDIGILAEGGSQILIAQGSDAAISAANLGATVYSEGSITYNSVCLTP